MKSAAAAFLLLPAPLMAEGKPLLANGDFGLEKLSPWECEEGKVVKADKNALLEVRLDSGVFGLSQDLAWPEKKAALTLKFRVKADQATPSEPVQLRLRWFDADGDSEISATKRLEKSGEWQVVTWTLEKPDLKVTSLMLESNRGEGKLWLDDFVLE
jgi:hypothetical protein